MQIKPNEVLHRVMKRGLKQTTGVANGIPRSDRRAIVVSRLNPRLIVLLVDADHILWKLAAPIYRAWWIAGRRCLATITKACAGI
jgi:hypothetical protein